MASQPADPGLDEFRIRVSRSRYVTLMVLLAIAAAGIQYLLVIYYLPLPGISANPSVAGLVGSSSHSIRPDNAALWNDELWVSLPNGSPQFPNTLAAPNQKSKLIAFNLRDGKPRDTNISLSPAPVGMVVVQGRLWCVSPSVVYLIDEKQAITRFPRRLLNQPSNPFEYEGRLAIIDRSVSNVYTLLSWNDQEWLEIGQVEIPFPDISARTWLNSGLRVVSVNGDFTLFYSDGNSIHFRSGISLIESSSPVSALAPQNAGDRGQGGFDQTGWTTAAIPLNWTSTWDVVEFNNTLRLYLILPYSTNLLGPLRQFERRGESWIDTTPRFPPQMATFGVAGNDRGYIATDDLRLYVTDGTEFQLLTSGQPLSERTRSLLYLAELFLRFLIPTGLLVTGTWLLMRSFKSPVYHYGKRTALHASVMSRALARAIDSLITVFPPIFWLMSVWELRDDNLWPYTGTTGFSSPLVWMISSVFGMWLGSVVVISVLEGQFGWTPGKRICGIRTFQTTLRTCGVLRALARELLIYIDSLFFLVWLPGVLLIAFTANWQRIGDLAADTIVVRVRHRESTQADSGD